MEINEWETHVLRGKRPKNPELVALFERKEKKEKRTNLRKYNEF